MIYILKTWKKCEFKKKEDRLFGNGYWRRSKDGHDKKVEAIMSWLTPKVHEEQSKQFFGTCQLLPPPLFNISQKIATTFP